MSPRRSVSASTQPVVALSMSAIRMTCCRGWGSSRSADHEGTDKSRSRCASREVSRSQASRFCVWVESRCGPTAGTIEGLAIRGQRDQSPERDRTRGPRRRSRGARRGNPEGAGYVCDHDRPVTTGAGSRRAVRPHLRSSLWRRLRSTGLRSRGLSTEDPSVARYLLTHS